MSKLTLSEFSKNKENPFLNEAIERINNHTVTKWKTATKTGEKAILKAYDENTGEDLGYTQFIRQIEMDEEQFTKFYLKNHNLFFNLKQAAIRVFLYILTQLKPNQAHFLFYMNDCMEYTKYSSFKSVYTGLTNLLNEKVIARGRTEYEYFINPLAVFNGNRVDFVSSAVRKKKEDNKRKKLEANGFTEVKTVKAPEPLVDENGIAYYMQTNMFGKSFKVNAETMEIMQETTKIINKKESI